MTVCYLVGMNTSASSDLLRAPLHALGPEDWVGWYPRVAELVEVDDAQLRAAAVERLSMAVFWAEKPPQTAPDEARRQRAEWLLGVIDTGSRRHPDVTLFFLKELRFKGDDEPFARVLVAWLRSLHDRRPPNVPLDLIEGTIVLIGGLDPWEGSLLPPILDHPSNYVRACAARMLAQGGYGETEDGRYDPRFIAELTAKELKRPGIVGPFWSPGGSMLSTSELSELGFDPVDWMLGIIEQREGPEPEDLPFNGIDFHIHELAAGDPEAIRRLIKAGRADLALMAATEIRGRVDSMTPALFELSDHRDPQIASPAQVHLAHYYGVLHPRADPARIRHLADRRDGVELFIIRFGPDDRPAEQVVIFPKNPAILSDTQAWALIDRALPPDLRGELAPHYLAAHDAAPAPYQLGRDEMRTFDSGAHVTLVGALDQAGWIRIDISARRWGDRWHPWML